jgi:hypothetical protein
VIIFRMGAKPFYLNSIIAKDNPHYQTELIADDIENYPVIANQAGISINFFAMPGMGARMDCLRFGVGSLWMGKAA